jgi:hypothetical protein
MIKYESTKLVHEKPDSGIKMDYDFDQMTGSKLRGAPKLNNFALGDVLLEGGEKENTIVINDEG